MNLTYAQIKAIVAPGGRADLVSGFADYLNKYGDGYGVNTYLRVCHFTAQCAEESDHFNTLHEYASGAEYQGRLGNIHPGDGVKYKGAGYIELTGLANYEAAGSRLNIDLVNHPELAQQPEVGMLVSLDYWRQHKLNVYADRDDILTITHLVNGGENGLSTRRLFLDKAKTALKDAEFSGAAPTPEPVPLLPPAERGLLYGDWGDDVKALQTKLGITADGDFGRQTRTAVMAFQTERGLVVDGLVGPLTRAALGL